MTAYIFVKATSGEADRIRDAIAAVDGVVDAHVVAGDVDFIAKVRVDTPADVKGVVADRIQAIDGVETTETYIAMDDD